MTTHILPINSTKIISSTKLISSIKDNNIYISAACKKKKKKKQFQSSAAAKAICQKMMHDRLKVSSIRCNIRVCNEKSGQKIITVYVIAYTAAINIGQATAVNHRGQGVMGTSSLSMTSISSI